jgi:hypothetical protein
VNCWRHLFPRCAITSWPPRSCTPTIRRFRYCRRATARLRPDDYGRMCAMTALPGTIRPRAPHQPHRGTPPLEHGRTPDPHIPGCLIHTCRKCPLKNTWTLRRSQRPVTVDRSTNFDSIFQLSTKCWRGDANNRLVKTLISEWHGAKFLHRSSDLSGSEPSMPQPYPSVTGQRSANKLARMKYCSGCRLFPVCLRRMNRILPASYSGSRLRRTPASGIDVVSSCIEIACFR